MDPCIDHGTTVACAHNLQGQQTKPVDPGAWATGIVEVPLPAEVKMRNIEETEAAKQKMLASVHGWGLNVVETCLEIALFRELPRESKQSHILTPSTSCAVCVPPSLLAHVSVV